MTCVCVCTRYQLNLSNMSISDRLAGMLLRAISADGHRARHVLTVLDLSRNGVGLLGARGLRKFLGGQCRMLRLSLAWNHLRGAAAAEAAAAIGVNNSLHVRACARMRWWDSGIVCADAAACGADA